MEIRDDLALKWPGKLKAPPAWRAKGKYCLFEKDHGHDINDCFDLKEQIEEFIQQGRLRRFVTDLKADETKETLHRPTTKEKERTPPLGEIQVIVGGSSGGGESTSTRKAHMQKCKQVEGKDVYTTRRLEKLAQRPDPSITFSEEDSAQLQHPHDDPLVVTVMIAGYRTRRVLVDNCSSAEDLRGKTPTHRGSLSRLHRG